MTSTHTVSVVTALALATLAASSAAQTTTEPPHAHGEHDMHAAQPQHQHAAPPMQPHAMQSAFGPYPMSREGSGTSWQPDATPMIHAMAHRGDWMLMAHGFVNAVVSHQSGPRGDDQAYTESMAMLMAQRPLGPGQLGLRAMLSLDPTMGRRGYPLLFQTGETADGVEPLVDRQHPHDVLMELSGSVSLPLGADGAVFVYAGLPGEPALGPPAFMHRYSGMRNPEAPLSHHWLDSTHITFGVVTLGASQGPWKLEASSFNGREPDQHRWNIETRRFDSWSTRLSFNPTPQWSVQLSHGDLRRPEQLEPDTRIQRTTASVSYQAASRWGPWQTTLAWGQNHKRTPEGSRRLPAWLLESTLVAHDRHTVFARLEQVKNDELFHHDDDAPAGGPAFRVRKLSLGYIFDFAKTGPVAWGIGGVVGIHDTPPALDAAYGRRPRSALLFLQGRL